MTGTAPPRDDQRWSDGLPLPKWALWLMLPGIVTPALIFGFILWTESAHDADRCPFRELSRATLSDGSEVVEEGRRCVADVEERRFRLERAGQTRILGERRFDAEAFGSGKYRWDAVVTKDGEVQVTVRNAGHDDLLLREGTAEEREKGISH
jgi:hypothetical protein